jgi:hypothetical protein
MDDRDMRAYLRAATGERLIEGWYHYDGVDGRHWVVNAIDGPTSTYDSVAVADFCGMLKSAGVEPRYRLAT